MKMNRTRSVLGVAGVGLMAICSGAEAAVDRIVERTGPVETLAPDEVRTATAQCQPDESLVGGGATGTGWHDGLVDDSTPRGVMLFSSGPDPSSERRWIVRGFNNNGQGLRRLTAYALCASEAPSDQVREIVHREAAPVSIGGRKVVSSSAHCRADELGVGGSTFANGGVDGFTATFLLRSAPAAGSTPGWTSQVLHAHRTRAHDLRTTAFCAKRTGRDQVQRIRRRSGDTVVVPLDSFANSSARCQAGETVVGGGTYASNTDFAVTISGVDPANPSRWLARGVSTGGRDGRLTPYVYCAS